MYVSFHLPGKFIDFTSLKISPIYFINLDPSLDPKLKFNPSWV